MEKIVVTVNNDFGLHARPASMIVKTAVKYDSEITIKRNSATINAKSILNILSMGIKKGMDLEIIAEGSDEKEAIAELDKLIKCNFNE